MDQLGRLSTGVLSISLILKASIFGQTPVRPPLRAFERRLYFQEPAEDSAGISVGDVNGDGWLDIVLANGRHTPIHNRVLLNDAKGHFVSANLDRDADRSYAVALADIDGDGDLDIVVGNDTPDRKMVYGNDGKGRFTRMEPWGESGWPTRYVSIADMNGDGHPDIVAANAGASLPLPIHYPSFVCFNDGAGRFPGCRALPAESAVVIPAADFDGDGAIDLFVPHRDGGRSFVLWTDPTLARAQSSQELASRASMIRTPFRERTFIGAEKMECRVAAAGDLNGDGRPDLVLYDDSGKTTSVFLNSGARSFASSFPLPTGNRTPFAITVADLNKDGRADIVIGYVASSTVDSRGSIFFGADGQNFLEAPWNDGKGTVNQIVVADIDKDGWPDIAAARTGAPSGIWFSTTPASRR